MLIIAPLGVFGVIAVIVLIAMEWLADGPSASCKHCGARWYGGGESIRLATLEKDLSCPACGKPRF